MNEIVLACLVLLGGFGLAAAFWLWARRLDRANRARQQELEKMGSLAQLAAAPPQPASASSAGNTVFSWVLSVILLGALPGFLLLLGSSLLHLGYRLGLGGPLVRTDGVVVRLTETYESGETFYIPDVRVVTQDGRVFIQSMPCAPVVCFPDAGIGSKVPVVYPRDHASAISIMSANIVGWINDLFILLIGGICVAFAVYYLGRRVRAVVRGLWGDRPATTI